MDQAKGMPQFMHDFLKGPPEYERLTACFAVIFSVEPPHGDYRRQAIELGLSKNKVLYRYVEINVAKSEDFNGVFG